MNQSLVILFLILVVLIALIVMNNVRRSEIKNTKSVWNKLADKAEKHSPIFEVTMLDGLPPLVKKYFLFMIKLGTPLHYVAEIKMHGIFAIGDANKSKDIKVKCHQIIAPMHGFVWKVRSTHGLIKFSGSDGFDDKHCWSRMWLLGLWPLWERNRHDNISKSSFGRMVAESSIWVLGALLPKKNVHWEDLDDDVIQATITSKLMTQEIKIAIDDNGQPKEIIFNRWSNANPNKQFRFQPFGAKVSDFKEVQGFMIPMQIEAGNHYGTKDYFSFYKMTVDSFEFV